MAISSVHPSTDSVTQALAQSKKAATTQQPPSATTLNTAHPTQTKSVQHSNQAQTTQAPKPVVNSQGQTTGKIVNATA